MKKSKNNKKPDSGFRLNEKIIVLMCTLLVWFVLSFIAYFHTASQNGDTAFVAQVLNNFRRTIKMESSYYTSTSESIDHVWYHTAEQVCHMDLQSKFVGNTPWGHHYFIAYLLIPLARAMDIRLLITVLHAGIFTSVLLFGYLIARKYTKSVPISLLVVLLISQHPLWRWGFDGQFYFNRFFLPLSGLVILLLERKHLRYIPLLLATALAYSSNEINGIFLFLIFCSSMWMQRKLNLKLFALGLACLFLSMFATSYIQSHYPLVSTQQGVFGSTFGRGMDAMIHLVRSNLENEKTTAFFIVNLLSIGIFMTFDVSLLPAFLIFILPNLFLSVGGAEKTGWQTHYHTGYFIPLIWMSVIGMSRINHMRWLQYLFIAICFISMIYIEPFTLSINSKPNIGVKTNYNLAKFYLRYGKNELKFREQLRDAVKDYNVLSIPEEISYPLYEHESYYYPMEIDRADAVILKYDPEKSGDKRFYSINYGQQDPKLDDCIIPRMKSIGYDVEHPTLVNNWAIIPRIREK